MNGVAVKALAGEQQHGIFLFFCCCFFSPSEFKEFQKKCIMGLGSRQTSRCDLAPASSEVLCLTVLTGVCVTVGSLPHSASCKWGALGFLYPTLFSQEASYFLSITWQF